MQFQGPSYYCSEEIMSATVYNVLAVVLRTPGESINATMKMSAIVFTLEGLLNVSERAINDDQKCSKQLWVVGYILLRELLAYVVLLRLDVECMLGEQVALQDHSLQFR